MRVALFIGRTLPDNRKETLGYSMTNNTQVVFGLSVVSSLSDEWKQPQCMFLGIRTFVHLALASHAGIFECSKFPTENKIDTLLKMIEY